MRIVVTRTSNKVANGFHIVGIELKDGKRSIIEMNNKKYRNFVQSCF